VHIEEAIDDTVVQWLLERRVELGFVVLPDERFDTLTLAEDELVAVLPAAHPGVPIGHCAMSFHGQPFIRTSAGSGPHIDAFWPARAPHPELCSGLSSSPQ
jgi:DNA-binding transcriptional LysR family regulator